MRSYCLLSFIKEEDPYFNEDDSPEVNAIRELFGVKDRLDLGSLMLQEFGDSKRTFLMSPPSPVDAGMMTSTMETDIKAEPR